jgi:hypothetical protein
MHLIKINDHVYEQAKQRASEAGFESVDEFISDVMSNVLSEETEDYDRFFTREIIADLDRVAGSVHAGAKTCTQEEFDEHFRKKSQAWRESHPS